MIVYDIWAEWCAPCKRFAPIFERVSQRFPDIKFEKINADENHEFLDKYDIRSIPTILITNDSGEVVFAHAGILTEVVFENIVSTFFLNSHK